MEWLRHSVSTSELAGRALSMNQATGAGAATIDQSSLEYEYLMILFSAESGTNMNSFVPNTCSLLFSAVLS